MDWTKPSPEGLALNGSQNSSETVRLIHSSRGQGRIACTLVPAFCVEKCLTVPDKIDH